MLGAYYGMQLYANTVEKTITIINIRIREGHRNTRFRV